MELVTCFFCSLYEQVCDPCFRGSCLAVYGVREGGKGEFREGRLGVGCKRALEELVAAADTRRMLF